MSGFDFIVIFIGACLFEFMLLDFFTRRRQVVFSNFDTLEYKPVDVMLLTKRKSVSGHTLIGYM